MARKDTTPTRPIDRGAVSPCVTAKHKPALETLTLPPAARNHDEQFSIRASIYTQRHSFRSILLRLFASSRCSSVPPAPFATAGFTEVFHYSAGQTDSCLLIYLPSNRIYGRSSDTISHGRNGITRVDGTSFYPSNSGDDDDSYCA